jgi:hypothetical protein
VYQLNEQILDSRRYRHEVRRTPTARELPQIKHVIGSSMAKNKIVSNILRVKTIPTDQERSLRSERFGKKVKSNTIQSGIQLVELCSKR